MSRAFAVVLALACLTVAGVDARAEDPTPRPRHAPRLQDRSQDLLRQQQQIRRARVVTRRILRDRRTSDAVKQQATELDALLDKRQQLIARLQERQKTFVAQHDADMDELARLRERARELDDRLDAARKDVLDASKDDIAALKDAATRAADLADALRTHYAQERGGHRRAPRPEPSGAP